MEQVSSMRWANIDVSIDILAHAVSMFPSTYRIIGSAASISPDTVRLVVASDDIEQDGQQLTCEVRDDRDTRKIQMIKV